MKKIFTLLFIGLTFLSFAQINVGNNQTICLGDTAQVIATTSVQASTDSYQVTSITFAPETTAGTPISLFDDDVQGPFPIGFTFQFYGINYTDFYVGSNGWLGFSSGQPTGYTAVSIPDSTGFGVPINCIMLSWEDLNPATGGQVLYQTIGNAPYRKMVLTFDNVPYFGSPTTAGPITSQVVLYEGSNVIDNHITDKPLHTNPSVQGIHNLLGTSATAVPGRNATVWSASNESVRYFPSGVSWFDVNSGQMVGVGDTLNYAPSQTTFIVGQIIDSTGQVFSDTMLLNVLNTQIITTGLSLCNGPIILTAASGFAFYVWSNNFGGPQILVNSPGSYYVNYITANGLACQSDSVTIYSNTIPISLSTPDSVFICQGDTIVIDGPTGFTSYNWSTGATTSSITTTLTGNYTLTVIDGNNCTGTSNTTTINISPQSISLSTTGYSLCNGPVTINAGLGYSSYLWNNNSTNQAIVVNFAGSYFVTVTYPAGCTAMSDTITIASATGQFYFPINTPGDDSLCQPNGQVILDAGNFVSFNWNTGATTQQITVASLGVYYVNVTDSNGCQGVSNPPFEVFNAVNTSAITGSINATQFQTETYSVTQSSGSTYNWWMNGGTIQSGLGTNTVDVIWNVVGSNSIYVLETDANGCIGDTISLAVTVLQSTNINEDKAEEISIYPNPFTKSTIISITNIKSNYNLTLYDITGQKVLEKEELNQNTYELERGTLSKGIYFLEIKTGASKRIFRVVVQ